MMVNNRVSGIHATNPVPPKLSRLFRIHHGAYTPPSPKTETADNFSSVLTKLFAGRIQTHNFQALCEIPAKIYGDWVYYGHKHTSEGVTVTPYL